MSNQLANAPQSPRTLKGLLDSPAIKSRFQEILGQHASSFVVNILNAAQANPAISDCDPVSVINAALTAASLGLSVNPALGQAAITPFNSRDGKKATLIVMVKGLISLAHDTGKYQIIHVAPIYEGEAWEEDRFTGVLRLVGNRQSSNEIGYVAYFRLTNGFEKYMAMTVDEIDAHGQQYSKSWDKANGRWRAGSVWAENPRAMRRKTVLRLLLTQYGPMTAKMERAAAVEEQEQPAAIDATFFERRDDEQPAAMSEGQALKDLGYN